MDIICRHCNATYTIADHKVPRQKAAAACRRCGNRIVIDPRPAPDRAPTPSAAPSPAIDRAAAPAPAAHDRSLVDTFPETAHFHPRRYAMSEIMPPDRKGRYRTRLNKLKLKILTAVKPTLDGLLKKDEQVMCIGGGTAYYPAEILFGNGILTMLYNRYALVATNQRLVMINVNHRMTNTRHYLFQLPYGELKKISRGLFRTSLSLTRKKGPRRLFTSMKKAFTGELQNFIAPRLTPADDHPPAKVPADCLCPACYAGLPKDAHRCPSCGAAFKSASKAALRSLLLPGWGDWYLGHRLLGGVELAGSLIVWSIVLNILAQGGAESAGVAAFILLFYNGFDALLARHMARKGIMLDPRPAEAEAPAKLATSHA